jgi:hypothetical protein
MQTERTKTTLLGKKATFGKQRERDSKSRQREEIHEEGLYDGKNLEDIDAIYPDMFSVCGESESDGELWHRSGPLADFELLG